MSSIRWKKKSRSCTLSAGITGVKARAKFMREASELAIELLQLPASDPRREHLKSDLQLKFVMLDSIADVLCPAAKLWNTGWGAQMMREAVSLMGGYGITEDCPGFLGNKWMDAQLEATYEGPEAVQRRQLSVTMTNPDLPRAVPPVDSRDARHRVGTSRHRSLCAGDGDDHVDVVA